MKTFDQPLSFTHPRKKSVSVIEPLRRKRPWLVGLALFLIPLCSSGSPGIQFGSAGELRSVDSPRDTAGQGTLSIDPFQPSVRVDDDLNPEHREPAIAWGANGELFAVYVERATHYNPELVMFTRSTDGGESWIEPAIRVNDTYPNAVIFPVIAVTHGGRIVVAWNEMKFAPYNNEIRFASSDDGGLTWNASLTVHPIDPSEDYYRPSIETVGDRILVAFFREIAYPNATPQVAISDDGGTTWAEPIEVSATWMRYDGSAPCIAYNAVRGTVGLVTATFDNRILFFLSADDGESWSSSVQVNQNAGASSANYADLACGSGFDFVVWSDNRNGQYNSDIWISRTEDGVQFGEDFRVDDGITGNQYEPHVRVDPNGRVHVCWIWNVPFGTDIDLYYSRSEDGGMSWDWPATRVNDIAYVVQPRVSWTSDLLADQGGAAYLVWNDGRATDYYDNIYFRTNRIPAGIDEAEEPLAQGSLFSAGNGSPKPFLIWVLDAPVATATIDLFDPAGRRVATIDRGPMAPGICTIPLSSFAERIELGSGIYYATVSTPRFWGSTKLVVLR